MAVWKNLKLTNKGKVLLTKIDAGGTLTFNNVKVGDGTWLDPEDPALMTNLVSIIETFSFSIIEGSVSGKRIIQVLVKNTNIPTAWEFKELGLYAEDPDDGEILFAATYAEDGDIIPASSVAPFQSLIKLNVNVGNATDVLTLFFDPTIGIIKQDFSEDNSVLVADLAENPVPKKINPGQLVGRRVLETDLIEGLGKDDVLEILGFGIVDGVLIFYVEEE